MTLLQNGSLSISLQPALYEFTELQAFSLPSMASSYTLGSSPGGESTGWLLIPSWPYMQSHSNESYQEPPRLNT